MIELDAAWNNYFRAFSADVRSRWAESARAFAAYRQARSDLGMPFYGAPEDGGWAASYDKHAAELQAMASIVSDALADVASGKRKIALGGGEFALGALPTDKWVLRGAPDEMPQLVTASSALEPGALGVPWAVLGVGAVLVTAAQAYTVVRAIDMLGTLSEQQTLRSLGKRQAELIDSGKATPAEAAELTASLYKGATALQVEKNKSTPVGDPEKWTGLVKTIGWAGAFLLVAYAVVKMVPAAAPRRVPA